MHDPPGVSLPPEDHGDAPRDRVHRRPSVFEPLERQPQSEGIADRMTDDVGPFDAQRIKDVALEVGNIGPERVCRIVHDAAETETRPIH
jgi:hypothetical protein